MSAMAKLDLSFLQQRFVAGLERRACELGGLVELLSIAQDDAETISRTMRAFHSLAGIGGTYGYGEITTIARSAETTCARAFEEGTPLEPREIDHLIGAVSAIREAHAAITSQAGTRALARFQPKLVGAADHRAAEWTGARDSPNHADPESEEQDSPLKTATCEASRRQPGPASAVPVSHVNR